MDVGTIMYHGTHVTRVSRFCYLGTILQYGMDDTPEIRRKIAIARATQAKCSYIKSARVGTCWVQAEVRLCFSADTVMERKLVWLGKRSAEEVSTTRWWTAHQMARGDRRDGPGRDGLMMLWSGACEQTSKDDDIEISRFHLLNMHRYSSKQLSSGDWFHSCSQIACELRMKTRPYRRR